MAKSQSVFPREVNFFGETKDAYRNLWRNVLIAALEDAIGKGMNDCGISKKNRVDSGRSYFLSPNRDFILVCQYAGFDHEYVRMKVKKYLEEAKNENKDYLQSMQW